MTTTARPARLPALTCPAPPRELALDIQGMTCASWYQAVKPATAERRMPAPPADPSCTPITAGKGQVAGFPYDVNDFTTNILPELQGGTGCEGGGSCHGAGSSPARFRVFSSANPGNGCPDVETFNQVVARSSYANGGAMSDIVKKIDGTVTHRFPSTSPASVEMATLLAAFIDTAKQTSEKGSDDGGAAAFDRNVFASQLQPVIDDVRCITGCHTAGGNAFGNFGLKARAQAGSPELEDNVQAILTRIDRTLDPTQATQAKIFVKATDGHGSRITNATALGNLANWIATGLRDP
jgi:hypothetical protein